jgi:hypothetical protein
MGTFKHMDILPYYLLAASVLYHVESLLCNDREMGGYTRPFLGNGSVNTFPQPTDNESNNRRDVISKVQYQLRLTSGRESVKRGLEPEAEE